MRWASFPEGFEGFEVFKHWTGVRGNQPGGGLKRAEARTRAAVSLWPAGVRWPSLGWKRRGVPRA